MTDWTVQSLGAHLCEVLRLSGEKYEERDRRYEERFNAQEKATLTALDAARTATSKAESAMERRLEGMNEFRAALTSQTAAFITREVFETRAKNMDLLIAAMREELAQTRGRGAGSVSSRALFFSVIAATGSIIGVVMLIVNLTGGG